MPDLNREDIVTPRAADQMGHLGIDKTILAEIAVQKSKPVSRTNDTTKPLPTLP